MDPGFSITDIDGYIAFAHNCLSMFPQSHDTHILWVHNLARMRFLRYKLSQEKEDIDKCILYYTEAIFLPPIPRAGSSSNVAHLLFRLASALLLRSQPHDIKSSIEYLRYLRGHPLNPFNLSRNSVTTLLTAALTIQVESEDGDETENVDEMVVLCRELLTSNLSEGFPCTAFSSLGDAVLSEFIQRGRSVRSFHGVIECLQDAVKMCPPGSHVVLRALAVTLSIRFVEVHSNDDYEEATALCKRILDPNQPGGCPDPIRRDASMLVTVLAYVRSVVSHNPQYSEVAISRLRTILGSSIDERQRLQMTNILESKVRERFTQYSLAESLEEADSYTPQSVDLSSSQFRTDYLPLAVRKLYSVARMAEEILHLEELLLNTPPGTEHHKECLQRLADWYESKFYRTDDISDLEESIKYGRLSLDANSSDLQRDHPLRFLSGILRSAFEKTGKISYLDESITVRYEILKLKITWPTDLSDVIAGLVSSLFARATLLGRPEDPQEAIRLLSSAVDDQHLQEQERYIFSCVWARLARKIGHPTIQTAYKSVMTLMHRHMSFAPTVSTQHTLHVKAGEDQQNIPLDYASFQINLGQVEEAIETLEQGRALLWSEMRGLRTPMAQLIKEDPPLAKRFAEINQELEALTISVTPSGRPEMEDGDAQGRDWTDPFGRLVIVRQKLVEERDALVSQIQGRPGLEGFLKAPSFTILRSAASRGPVVFINHSQWRSDILILVHNSLPCSIPTVDDFYPRARKLRDELVEARKRGLDSDEYQDALCSVLKGLHELVGDPVIKRLRQLGVPEQSRIWWCPTSVFCSLPLHAMGPIPSSDTSEQYFSDLYIPSYTPSLSALIESRESSPQMLEKPSLLLVAQPEDSLPGVKGEIKVIRSLNAQVVVADLVSSEATPSSVIEGLRGSQFAHFACHGLLETGKPFEASFKLHSGSRLTLLDIIRSRLPDAEFAFLSCCHAAGITDESVADEALHLTAAMQYCGFRSVVGTMWEMADTDGRDLAKSFYKSLFSGLETGVPYYERSAGALRDATQKLRGKRGISLERWVNFVHYGA